MAEASVASDASTAAVGKLIRYVGEFCYGYSGSLTINNVEQTMLESSTGNFLLFVNIQFGNLNHTGQDFLFQVYLNDLLVAGLPAKTDATQASTSMESGLSIIIPPFTTIKVTGQNKESSTAKDWTTNLTGRVYDA